MTDYLLWLGGVFVEDALKHPAVSTAANRWQKGLLEALNQKHFPVFELLHFPEPVFPKGKLRPGVPNDVASDFDNCLVNYWNLPVFRTMDLRRVYLKAFRNICKRRGKPLAVFSYNPTPWAAAVGLYAQKYLQVPWVDVCADHYEPGPGWESYSPGAERAAGHVFLSCHAFNSCPYWPKMHLDGGINRLRFEPDAENSPAEDKKIILYTGMLNAWGGVSFLLKAFRLISGPDIELWICGPGINSDLEAARKSDPRIKFQGLVSEERLQRIYRQAAVLVNPRPNNINGNTMNFPSKVLEYLSYGKPVVSTWTPGLSPDYREVLEVLPEENERCLAETLQNVLQWPDERKKQNSVAIGNYLLNHKTWEKQSDRLVDWLRNDVLLNFKQDK
ncbi:MAG: glycosyltransferase [Victivallaceae bacterium]|nr:glycosyltransferase [Victivallaceae bacterium]